MAELFEESSARSHVCDHLVQVYRDAGELAEAAAIYLAAGFEAGEPGIVVATAAHWPLFADRLEKRGWRPAELEAEGMLLRADAEETLAAILGADGRPSLRRFNAVIGDLMDRATGDSPRRRLRAFGEMVDILCRRGEAQAADELEDLWNRLGSRRNFSLLCGYRVDVFDRQAEISLIPQVCRSHSQVLPAPDAHRMDRAVDDALREVLGAEDAGKVYALASKQAGTREVPTAQLALMWVSAHMPRSAERILETARMHYVGTVAA